MKRKHEIRLNWRTTGRVNDKSSNTAEVSPTTARAQQPKLWTVKFKQESRAVARKTRDAAAVLFGLKFADIHYKFNSIAKLRKPGCRTWNIPAQNII